MRGNETDDNLKKKTKEYSPKEIERQVNRLMLKVLRELEKQICDMMDQTGFFCRVFSK